MATCKRPNLLPACIAFLTAKYPDKTGKPCISRKRSVNYTAPILINRRCPKETNLATRTNRGVRPFTSKKATRKGGSARKSLKPGLGPRSTSSRVVERRVDLVANRDDYAPSNTPGTGTLVDAVKRHAKSSKLQKSVFADELRIRQPRLRKRKRLSHEKKLYGYGFDMVTFMPNPKLNPFPQTSAFWSDIVQLTGSTLLIVGALLPLINPLGDAPIFLRMTPGCDEATRTMLAKRIAIYSFVMLLVSLLLGSFILVLCGLSVPVVQVAGDPWCVRLAGNSWPTFQNRWMGN